MAGGLLYGVAPEVAYGDGRRCSSLSPASSSSSSRGRRRRRVPEPATWETVVAGFRYIWREKIVLGAISLDLFAVLLGGAIALLPVYARDILEVGPWGLGLLRAAPGDRRDRRWPLYLATHPLRDHAGLMMFVFVGLFGLFTRRLRPLDDRLAVGRWR